METFDNPNVNAGASYGTQQTATEGQRIAAYLVDVLLVIIVGLIPILGAIVGLAYMVTRDALPFLDGQSVGKKLMKIRAVSADGAPLTNNWGPAIIRNVVLFIPFFPLVELIVLLTNPQKLRLGDQWAKTKVVVEPGA
ncbi:MAG: hypothetical protein OHK0039_37120 [Bacteroidia bacterium]